MKIRYLLTLCLFFTCLYSWAQTPEELVEKFFNEYKNEGVEVSLDNLYSTNPWISRSNDAVSTLKSRLIGLNEDLVGLYRGSELIVKRTIGEIFVLFSYMVKYDRQPIRFTFQFYKPQDKWIVYGFLFDDELDDELEESAKIHNIKATYNN